MAETGWPLIPREVLPAPVPAVRTAHPRPAPHLDAGRQLTFFGAETIEPSPADLAGLLAGPGHLGRMGGTARIGIRVDAAWRVHVLSQEFVRRGLVVTWLLLPPDDIDKEKDPAADPGDGEDPDNGEDSDNSGDFDSGEDPDNDKDPESRQSDDTAHHVPKSSTGPDWHTTDTAAPAERTRAAARLTSAPAERTRATARLTGATGSARRPERHDSDPDVDEAQDDIPEDIPDDLPDYDDEPGAAVIGGGRREIAAAPQESAAEEAVPAQDTAAQDSAVEGDEAGRERGDADGGVGRHAGGAGGRGGGVAGAFEVRTAYSSRLNGLARSWPAAAGELFLSGPRLRLWVAAAGAPREGGYALGLDPATDPAIVDAALVRVGLAGTVSEDGRYYLILGRKRLTRLAELVGERPKEAPAALWPGGVAA